MGEVEIWCLRHLRFSLRKKSVRVKTWEELPFVVCITFLWCKDYQSVNSEILCTADSEESDNG